MGDTALADLTTRRQDRAVPGAADTAATVFRLATPGGDDSAAGQAGLLWTAAIRHAVLTGSLDARIGLGHLDDHARRLWLARLAEAEATTPSGLATVGPVGAVQRAWSAITRTPAPVDDRAAGASRGDHLQRVLDAAPRDAAPLAGALLGAAYGSTTSPTIAHTLGR